MFFWPSTPYSKRDLKEIGARIEECRLAEERDADLPEPEDMPAAAVQAWKGCTLSAAGYLEEVLPMMYAARRAAIKERWLIVLTIFALVLGFAVVFSACTTLMYLAVMT